MSAKLLKRANDHRAHFKNLEGVKGSGFHDDDRNPARNDLFLAPQKNGEVRMSERLVHFTDHEEEDQCFVGPDAEKAFAALQAWRKKCDGSNPNLPGTDRKLFHKIIPKLAIENVDGVPRLCVWLCDWNDVVHALHAEGVGLLGLPLEG